MRADINHRLVQLNPWLLDRDAWDAAVARSLPTPFVPRAVDSSRLLHPQRATLVVGPRQAGKSTMVWSLLADRAPGEVVVLNMDDQLLREWAGSAVGLVDELRRSYPGVRVIFLEEVQNHDEAGLLIKGIVDAKRGYVVVVTGSSAFDLQARTRESLAGRATRRVLLPLSTRELLDWHGDGAPGAIEARAVELVSRQLVYGSYPAVWFEDAPEAELRDIREAFVVRDASDRYRIRHVSAFRRLLQLAAGQVGQMINESEWASILGISRATVSGYLDILEQGWILRRVPPFSGGRRREITSARRVHFYDVGLRNACLEAFSPDLDLRPDRGALFEGFVFGELARTLPADAVVHYWRAKGGAEVDFVAWRGGRVVPVEVKGRDSGRPSRSLRSFVETYEPEAAVVACASLDRERVSRLGSTEVVWVPLWRAAAITKERLMCDCR